MASGKQKAPRTLAGAAGLDTQEPNHNAAAASPGSASERGDIFGRPTAPPAGVQYMSPRQVQALARSIAEQVARTPADRSAYSITEVARRAGLSVRTVRNAIDSGALLAHRPGNGQHVRILAEDEAAWLRAREGLAPDAHARAVITRASRNPSQRGAQ